MLKPPIIVTPPASEPLSLEDAKAYLRVDGDEENDLITALIVVARDYCQNVLDGPIMATTIDQKFDSFPTIFRDYIIELPAPLQSVESVKYIDTEGTEQTWSSDEYEVDTVSKPGRLRPKCGYSYPATKRVFNAVTVQCVIGYDDPPPPILQAMKLVVNAYYANRELVAQVFAGNIQELPSVITADALLSPYRIFR